MFLNLNIIVRDVNREDIRWREGKHCKHSFCNFYSESVFSLFLYLAIGVVQKRYRSVNFFFLQKDQLREKNFIEKSCENKLCVKPYSSLR